MIYLIFYLTPFVKLCGARYMTHVYISIYVTQHGRAHMGGGGRGRGDSSKDNPLHQSDLINPGGSWQMGNVLKLTLGQTFCNLPTRLHLFYGIFMQLEKINVIFSGI